MDTTVGRVILNDVLPDDMPFINVWRKEGPQPDGSTAIFSSGHRHRDDARPCVVAGPSRRTRAGISTTCTDDMTVPSEKAGLPGCRESRSSAFGAVTEGAITQGERQRTRSSRFGPPSPNVWKRRSGPGRRRPHRPCYSNPITFMADFREPAACQQISPLSGSMRGLMAKPSRRFWRLPSRPTS